MNRSLCRSSIALDHCQCAICDFMHCVVIYARCTTNDAINHYLVFTFSRFNCKVRGLNYLQWAMNNEQWHKIQNNPMNLAIGMSLHFNYNKVNFYLPIMKVFHISPEYFENANRLRVNERSAKSEKIIEAKNEFFLHFNFIEVLNFVFFSI